MPQAFFYFVWSSFLICAFLGWYFTFRACQEERQLLIQQGFKPEYVFKRRTKRPSRTLKIACVLLGLGSSLLIIGMLHQFHLLGKSDVFELAIVLLCTGSSLVIAHRLEKRGNNE